MQPRKDRYGFDMDFLSMVPPVVEMQQARATPGSTYIEIVEREAWIRQSLWDDKEVWIHRKGACDSTEARVIDRRRRLNLRVASLGVSWAMDRRYSISFAYDAVTRTVHVAEVYMNGKALQGIPPICTDEEFRELCAMYLEEELKDRVDAARRDTIKDFLVEVNVEKYLRQPLGGR